MTLPRISVIIPVFNGEQFLGQALESVFQQDYPDLEIIAVDDGSTDGSPEILASYPVLRTVRQENRGVAAARNAGLELARGEFIAFLDQDDLWLPGKSRRQVDFLQNHHEVEGVVVHQEMFLQPGTEKPPWLRKRLLEAPHQSFVPSVFMARGSLFEKIGTFDETYRNGSDSDLMFRAADAGLRIETIPEVLVRRRIHDANESRHMQTNREEILRLIKDSILRKKTLGAS